jgi:hypothetical protein
MTFRFKGGNCDTCGSLITTHESQEALRHQRGDDTSSRAQNQPDSLNKNKTRTSVAVYSGGGVRGLARREPGSDKGGRFCHALTGELHGATARVNPQAQERQGISGPIRLVGVEGQPELRGN